MQMIRYRPAAPLDRYVECFWWSHRDQPQDHGEHMLPSGRAQLLFALHGTPIVCQPSASGDSLAWSGSILHGPQSAYYRVGPKPRGSVAGVSFRAGAAGAVLGAPLAELADRHVPLDALWGRRGVDLHEQLVSAAEPRRIFRILEQALAARICRPLLAHPAVAHALASGARDAAPMAKIADIQRASGYSPRHFIALFHSAVGLNPKRYYRIGRFNRAARSIASGSGHGLGDVASASGYSDQAHLTRDFRELAGVTPTQYRPGGADRPLHHRVVAGVARADR